MFEALFNYENAKRASLNEPLLKDYPQAPPGLQDWITKYIAADKAGRKSLRNANMDQFNAMQNYMASVDEYNLAKTAGQAKFQGTDFSQANLKQIYNLGQYDIAPQTLNGVTTYSVDPTAAFKASGGSGGYRSYGSSSGLSKAYANLKASNQAREARNAVKYAGKKPYIRIKTQGSARRRLDIYKRKPIRLASAPSTGKLRIKSVPVS